MTIRQRCYSLFLIACIGCEHVDAQERLGSTLLQLEFREGTDMEAVPSPDGRRLALQLWQHIWILDVDGGEARSITNPIDPADEHWFPRWSPDGHTIVFSSFRRDGGLYLVPSTGGEPRRLTDDPLDVWASWSPDGRTIAFWRRWGRGVWTVRADGGMPSRLTPDTVDAVMPTWSPDGRWIVYSARGRLFLMAPDGSSVRQLTSGPGDQAASWSPSGRELFFLSSRTGRQQLWAVSIDGGEPRRLADDEDLYLNPPRWLPGRDILLYTAAGAIRTIDTASGVRDSIPFRANLALDRDSYSRRRPQIHAPGTRVRSRGMSRIAPSPDGRQFVIAALGDLWLRTADGNLHQLTSGPADDGDPVFSPDGRRLAFVSNDSGDYQLYTLDLASGVRRRVSADAGWVENPVWRFDGDSIAFVYTRARFEGAPSLRVVASSGGATRARVESNAFALQPHAWTEDQGLLFSELRFAQRPTTRLMRVSRDEPEVVAEWPDMQLEFVAVSPSGRHVAIVDRGELRVRSLADSLERSVGVWAVFFPQWAGEGHVVYLSGGEPRVVDVVTGARQRLAVELSYMVAPDPPRTLIRNARLLTPEPRPGRWDLLLADGVIRSIQPAGSASASADTILDANGRTVMPGLIDVHAHLVRGFSAVKGMLYWGVTSLGDAGGEGHEQVALLEAIESGRETAPRIFPAAGFIVNPSWNAAPQFLRIDTQDQLEAYLDHLSELGATQVKSYGSFDPWLRAAAARGAHERGLPFLSHHFGPAIVAAGLDRKEHALYDGQSFSTRHYRLRQDATEILRKAEILLTPTLTSQFLGTSAGRARYLESLSDSAVSSFMPPSIVAIRMSQFEGPARNPDDANHFAEVARANTGAAHAAGVTLAAGVDRSDNPLAMHWELEQLVEAGLSPLEALRAATRGSAEAIGVEDRLGSITEGAFADLVILDRDPLDDIRNTQRIWAVIKGGQLVDRDRMLANVRSRERP